MKEVNGKYGYYGQWSRLCKCGHPLAVHAAPNETGKRDCFNEDTGIRGATGTDCNCENFKLAAPHEQQ